MKHNQIQLRHDIKTDINNTDIENFNLVYSKNVAGFFNEITKSFGKMKTDKLAHFVIQAIMIICYRF